MLPLEGKINTDKLVRGKLVGNVYHLFKNDQHAYLFDADLISPIIWGTKSIVQIKIKTLDKLIEIISPAIIPPPVIIYKYKFHPEGYKPYTVYYGTFDKFNVFI